MKTHSYNTIQHSLSLPTPMLIYAFTFLILWTCSPVILLSSRALYADTAANELKGIAIRAGKILTVTKGVINGGVVLVKNGKIETVGKDLAVPKDYKLIDASDKWLMPGMVDIHSHIGGFMRDINDMVNPTNPELSVLETIDPDSENIKDARTGGVTTILYLPGSGTNMSGFGVLMKLAGKTPEDMVIRPLGVIKVAQAYNPERRGGDLGLSRMGMSWGLRDTLRRARDYSDALIAYEKGERKAKPPFRPELEKLKGLFRGEYPVLIHTASAKDVMATARIFHDELKVWTIVSHATFDGYKVAAEMGKRNLPVNIGPRMFDFGFSRDNIFYGLVAEYQRGGAKKLSINTDAPVVPQEELFFQAAMSIRFGLDEETALRCVTINPAKAIGVADRIGSIEVGKDADLVIKGGSPFDIVTPVEMVLINGKIAYDRSDRSVRNNGI